MPAKATFRSEFKTAIPLIMRASPCETLPCDAAVPADFPASQAIPPVGFGKLHHLAIGKTLNIRVAISSRGFSCRFRTFGGCLGDGRAFSRPPEGLVLDGREHDGTLAVSERKTTMRSRRVRLVTTAILATSRFPFPQSLQKSGNSDREVHRLSRFRDHQTTCSCLYRPAKGSRPSRPKDNFAEAAVADSDQC